MDEQRTAVENGASILEPSADQDVIVEMRLPVPVDSVGEAHDTAPPPALVSLHSVAPIPHHQRTLLQVFDRGPYRLTVRFDDPRSTRGIKCDENGYWSRSGKHQVVSLNLRAFGRGEDSGHVEGFTNITLASKPPTRSSVAQAVQLVGTIVREIGNVV